MALRRLRDRRRLISAPAAATRALRAYTAGRWDRVITLAPAALALPIGDGDDPWRGAVELALGHALVRRDRPAEAVEHLERGLARSTGPVGADAIGSEARMRHMLGYALSRTGAIEEARAEYRRVLELPGLDPQVRMRVEAADHALEDRA